MTLFCWFFVTLKVKIFCEIRWKLTNRENLFRESWNPFIQNTKELYYDFWELDTVEPFAFLLLNYNWLNHKN